MSPCSNLARRVSGNRARLDASRVYAYPRLACVRAHRFLIWARRAKFSTFGVLSNRTVTQDFERPKIFAARSIGVGGAPVHKPRARTHRAFFPSKFQYRARPYTPRRSLARARRAQCRAYLVNHRLRIALEHLGRET